MKKILLLLPFFVISFGIRAQHDPFNQYVHEQKKKDSMLYILRRGYTRYRIPDTPYRTYRSIPPRQLLYITRWDKLIPKNEKRGKLVQPW